MVYKFTSPTHSELFKAEIIFYLFLIPNALNTAGYILYAQRVLWKY